VILEPPQESQVLLTLTNPVENITHVTLLECEEGDPDDINSTAKVSYPPAVGAQASSQVFHSHLSFHRSRFSYVLQSLLTVLHFPPWSLNDCQQCKHQMIKDFEIVSVPGDLGPRGEIHDVTGRLVTSWYQSGGKLRMNHFSVKL